MWHRAMLMVLAVAVAGTAACASHSPTATDEGPGDARWSGVGYGSGNRVYGEPASATSGGTSPIAGDSTDTRNDDRSGVMYGSGNRVVGEPGSGGRNKLAADPRESAANESGVFGGSGN